MFWRLLLIMTIFLLVSARKPKNMKEYLRHLKLQHNLVNPFYEDAGANFLIDFQKFKELPENKKLLRSGLFALYSKDIDVKFIQSSLESDYDEKTISKYFPLKSEYSAHNLNEALSNNLEFYDNVKFYVFQRKHFRYFGPNSLTPFFKEEFLHKSPNLSNSTIVKLFTELVPKIGRSTFSLNFADKDGKHIFKGSQKVFNNYLAVKEYLKDENHYSKVEEIYDAECRSDFSRKIASNKEL